MGKKHREMTREERNAYQREWRKNNYGIRQRMKRSYAYRERSLSTVEARREYQRQYYQDHKDKALEYQKLYYQQNKGRRRGPQANTRKGLAFAQPREAVNSYNTVNFMGLHDDKIWKVVEQIRVGKRLFTM